MFRALGLMLVLLGCACADPHVQREAIASAPTRSFAHPEVAPAPTPTTPAHGPVPAQAAPSPVDLLHSRPLEQLVEAAIARGELPGCVVAIGTRSELLYLRAFGERTRGEPMTLDTRFDLASLTKPIATAASLMALVEQGAVELDAPAHRYLSELRTPDKRAITVRQLLVHTSGLPRVNALSELEHGKAHALQMIARQTLLAAPGTRFEYSDLGFILLGALVERVTGMELDTYAAQRLFEPLGMRETRFVPPPEEAARCAPTEERDEQVIRGVVDDPRAYRLGGVAGHAGLFSTATDVARFARMLLRRGQIDDARVLAEDTVARFLQPEHAGGAQRALGLDCQSPYAHGRGFLFSPSAVGHGGYTGTSLWLDSQLDLYVVVLSNRVHAGPKGTIHPLASSIADLAARERRRADAHALYTGIDVLAQSAFAPLRGRSVALLTHAAARDREGVRTLDHFARAPGLSLKAILTPEHGLDAKHEGAIANRRFGALPVYSLFGKTRKPAPDMLRGCDTIVIDLVDVGTRFYTYMASVLSVLEAASELGLEVVLLDRPNPIGGMRVEGPVSQTSYASFVNYHPLPLRHGMTAGELARFLVSERALPVRFQVIPVEGWQRERWIGETDLAWYPPSPNLGTKEQAMLYPAIALVEGTNLSVGRGTDHAFQVVGAPFIDAERLAAELQKNALVGVSVAASQFRPTVGPYAGTQIPGVRFSLLDPHGFSAAHTGLALIDALTRLYPEAWDRTRLDRLVAHRATLDLLGQGTALPAIEASWAEELRAFASARERALLY